MRGAIDCGTVAKRRGRPTSPPDSVEQGLRDLAKYEGPDVSRLAYPYSDGLRTLMALTAPLEEAGLPAEERARALLQYIREQIGAFSDQAHPKCKAALQAAFCLTPDLANGHDYPSITSRLEYATRVGAFGETAGPEAGERNWRRAVKRLAQLVEKNVDRLVVRPVGPMLAYRVDISRYVYID